MILGGCAKTGASPVPTARRASPRSTEPLPRVHFPTASDRVLARELSSVESNALWMNENPAAVLLLEGHCDERGDEDYNLELGDRRARSVMEMLMGSGVEADRIIVTSKGEAEPIARGSGPASWRRNRRVEFIVR